MMAGLEDIVGKTGNYTVRDKFKRFDNRFIRPYLIRDHKVSDLLINPGLFDRQLGFFNINREPNRRSSKRTPN